MAGVRHRQEEARTSKVLRYHRHSNQRLRAGGRGLDKGYLRGELLSEQQEVLTAIRTLLFPGTCRWVSNMGKEQQQTTLLGFQLGMLGV